MRPLLFASLTAVLILGSTACATGTGGSASSSSAPAGSRELLLREEMDRGQWANAYEAVRSLRPQWLRVRGRDTITGDPGEVQVVLDDVRLGGPDVLRTLPLGGITYIQFIDGITASQRWGMGFGNGAIFVSTRPR